jgi:hypothetical protein
MRATAMSAMAPVICPELGGLSWLAELEIGRISRSGLRAEIPMTPSSSLA